MSTKFEITAEPRSAKGTGASRRLRRAGKVPAILYGAGKPPTMIALDHSVMWQHLHNERFHTAILTVRLGEQSDQAVLRDWQMHPYKPEILHIDLQRISATEKIHMKVPLHFVGEDVAPGVKQEGGIVSHLMTEVDVTCLPHQLPEFLTVDLSKLGIGDSVHLSDIPLPEGVQITALAHGGDDLAVATIVAPRVQEEDETAAAAAAEAAASTAAAPAEGEVKKTEPKKEGK